MIRYVFLALIFALSACGPAEAPVLPPSASAPLPQLTPEVLHDAPRVDPSKKGSTVNDALDRVDERLKAIKERDIHTAK